MALPKKYDPMLDDIRFVNGRAYYYKLLDRIAVPCSLRDWVAVFQSQQRLALDEITRADSDPVTVSTVFLGLDHNHWGEGPPILFETMAFGGPLDQHQVRYTTYGSAMRGHAELLAEVRTTGELTAARVKARIAAILAMEPLSEGGDL